RAALSPTQYAAIGLAGCMAAHGVDILREGRPPLTALPVTLTGTRAGQPPRRVLQIELCFDVHCSVPPDAGERGTALSREKYCSVWHSFRQDIALSTTFHITP